MLRKARIRVMLPCTFISRGHASGSRRYDDADAPLVAPRRQRRSAAAVPRALSLFRHVIAALFECRYRYAGCQSPASAADCCRYADTLSSRDAARWIAEPPDFRQQPLIFVNGESHSHANSHAVTRLFFRCRHTLSFLSPPLSLFSEASLRYAISSRLHISSPAATF